MKQQPQVEKVITQAEFLMMLLKHEFVDGFKSCEFIQFTSETTPTLRKTGLPFQNVSKVTTTKCALKAIYENCVNNHLVRKGEDPDFVAEPLPWGSWVEFNGQRSKILIQHKGSFYIRTTFLTNEKPEVFYIADGNMVDKEVLAPWMAEKKKNENGVEVRTFKLSSMKEIRLNHTKYVIKD